MSVLIGVADFGIEKVLSDAQTAAQQVLASAQASAQAVIDQADDANEGSYQTLQAATAANTQAQNYINQIAVYQFTPISTAQLRTQAGLSGSSCKLMGYYTFADGGGGDFYWDASSTAADNGGTIFKVAGVNTGRWIRTNWTELNVKMFGATGDGGTNDQPAIQACINYARTVRGGSGKLIVRFPNGSYKLSGNGGLDITNASGVWLTGGSGSYTTTGIVGNCGDGPIFDFTGSTQSGCEGFSFFVFNNNEYPTPATIGVLFALGENGLSNTLQNCFFFMQDNATANGGLGRIAMVNIRSEQFNIHNNLIRANCCMLFSNQATVVTDTASFTFTSRYTPIKPAYGSMGVVSANGNSLETYARRAAPLILNGTNSITFLGGYFARGEDGNGSVVSAVEVYQPNTNIKIVATAENFGTLLDIKTGAKFYNSNFELAYANTQPADRTPPVIYMRPNSRIWGSHIMVTFNNGSPEMENRRFLYADPVDAPGDKPTVGNSPTTASLVSSTFTVPEWGDNSSFVSANLLKQTSGVCRFESGQPFSKDNNWLIDNTRTSVELGNLTNIGKRIKFFNLADNGTYNLQNGGEYFFKLKGVLKVGDYSSAGRVAVNFEVHIIVAQNANGARSLPTITTPVFSKVATNPSYADITAVSASLDFLSPFSNLNLLYTASGSGTSEKVTALVEVSMITDFKVNHSVLFAV